MQCLSIERVNDEEKKDNNKPLYTESFHHCITFVKHIDRVIMMVTVFIIMIINKQLRVRVLTRWKQHVFIATKDVDKNDLKFLYISDDNTNKYNFIYVFMIKLTF